MKPEVVPCVFIPNAVAVPSGRDDSWKGAMLAEAAPCTVVCDGDQWDVHHTIN